MNENNGLDRFTIFTVLFLTGVLLGCILTNMFHKENAKPVEEVIKIDSLKKVNDSIKIKVEQLDSIKNAKIIEVESLDNDSTLKLFYELIRK